jgi:hypothetical protein
MKNEASIEKNNKVYTSIDQEVSSFINQLLSSNPFFQKEFLKKIDLYSATNIAFNWSKITRTFLFTSIIGLGSFAKKIIGDNEPSEKLLSALQTYFSIISDDLNNTNIIFNHTAPLAYKGIHFKWWDDSILSPLKIIDPEITFQISNSTQKLIDKMNQLSNYHLGIALQLRVVEAIALDICRSFYMIFNEIRFKDRKIFNETDLAWITTHLRAEEYHHHQARDTISGIICNETSISDQKYFLGEAQEYIKLWSNVLIDFTNTIK